MTDGRLDEFFPVVPVGAVALVAVLGGCSGPSGSDADPFSLAGSDTGESNPETSGDTGRIDDDGSSSGAPTGAPCDDSDDCAGDICVRADEYLKGYCTDYGCKPGECSGANGVCVEFSDGTSSCFATCGSDADCREGYKCEATGMEDDRVCTPGTDHAPFGETRRALGVQCNAEQLGTHDGETRYRLEFELGPDAQSFLMVPFVTSGTLRPIDFTTPRRTVDLRDGYLHHNSRITDAYSDIETTGFGTYGEIAFDWPIGVPYAPQYDEYAIPGGRYELRVDAGEAEPCLYVLEKQSGRKLDLNFYFVGANGLSPQSAKTDRDFQEALGWMDHLYDAVGVEIGTLRYYELSDELEARFEVVNDREEAHRLTAQGEPPSETLAGHLSVDVFLVNTLRLENQAGESVNVLGMSAGVPGAAGMHGNARNGLVFQTADLGFDNRHVGLVMAHEIGHYLGLRHTTEIFYGTEQGSRLGDLYGSTDPIEDTAICENISDHVRQDPSRCTDYENLMFPVAPPPDEDQDAKLTSGQGSAMRANPLVTDR